MLNKINAHIYGGDIMKQALCLVGLLLSLNANAGLENLNSALMTSFNQKISMPQLNSSMIYVGQDIAHPLVAIANESIWSGQNVYIG
jgi:hypothetical protein